jgi:hypothetical protein
MSVMRALREVIEGQGIFRALYSFCDHPSTSGRELGEWTNDRSPHIYCLFAKCANFSHNALSSLTVGASDLLDQEDGGSDPLAPTVCLQPAHRKSVSRLRSSFALAMTRKGTI